MKVKLLLRATFAMIAKFKYLHDGEMDSETEGEG